ncbi:hypothetical protein LX36DRAFT_706913 [Colletotrichum falcatum]|nr:hypothetical protein LX36DRAFT_706913 [Colletotrichum falcatum]
METNPRPISKKYCDDSQQVSDALREWYRADRPLSFAHVQGPLRFGSDERANVVKILRDTANCNTAIFYLVNPPQDVVSIQKRLETGDTSDSSASPELAVVTPVDGWEKIILQLISKFPTLLIFDVEEQWGAGFCLDMLKLSLLAKQWPSSSKLRILWLSSAPWDTLLSRIMAYPLVRDGVSTTRICLPQARESIKQLRWTAYKGPLSEDHHLAALARNIVIDHQLLGGETGPAPAAAKGTDTGIVVSKCDSISAWPAGRPPVRHLVLQDRVVRQVWDRRLRQVVHALAPPLIAVTRAQAATVYADGIDPAAVRVHAFVPVEDLDQADQPRKFEEVHLASLITAAMQLDGASSETLQVTLLTDSQRWEAATYKAKLARFIVQDDARPGGYVWPVESPRAARATKWMKLVGYDFSVAQFLSAIDDKTPRVVRDAMLDIGAILASAEQSGDDLVTFDHVRARGDIERGSSVGKVATKMDRDCYGIPPGISATGSLWMALGVYRAGVREITMGRLSTESNIWTSRSRYLDVRITALLRTERTAQRLKGACTSIAPGEPASDGGQDAEMTQEDVDLIGRFMFESWVNRLVFTNYQRTFAGGEPFTFAPWTGGVYFHGFSIKGGFFPGESFSTMPDGTAFLVGTGCSVTEGATVLQNPTVIPSLIGENWLRDEGLDVYQLRPPIYHV